MPGRPSTFRYLFAGLSPLFALPSAGAAQVNLEFVPYAGVYVPMQKLVDQFIPSSAPFGCNCQFSLEQKRQATLGGRLTVWWTSHLGAEATLGYSGSGVSTVGTQVDDSSAHVVTVSARANGNPLWHCENGYRPWRSEEVEPGIAPALVGFGTASAAGWRSGSMPRITCMARAST